MYVRSFHIVDEMLGYSIKQPIGGKELQTNHREYNFLQKIDGKQGYHTRKIDDKQVFQKKIKVNNKCTTYCTLYNPRSRAKTIYD